MASLKVLNLDSASNLEGFSFGDFTDSIVTETMGIAWVGYIMALYGGCDSIFSVLCGKLMDHFGKRFLIVIGALTHGGCYLFFILWIEVLQMFSFLTCSAC